MAGSSALPESAVRRGSGGETRTCRLAFICSSRCCSYAVSDGGDANVAMFLKPVGQVTEMLEFSGRAEITRRHRAQRSAIICFARRETPHKISERATPKRCCTAQVPASKPRTVEDAAAAIAEAAARPLEKRGPKLAARAGGLHRAARAARTRRPARRPSKAPRTTDRPRPRQPNHSRPTRRLLIKQSRRADAQQPWRCPSLS